MKTARTLLLALLTAFAPALVLAQTVGGTVQGRVTDPNGRVVAGADVVLTSDRTGAKTTGVTDERGWYLFVPVDPGGYSISIGREGFRRHTQAVTVLVNQVQRVDAVLQAGSMSEVVTVTAPASILDRSAGSLRFRFEADPVANLPLDGRNFLELALLGPGAAPNALGSAGSVRGDFAFNVNGAREDANAYLLDGALNVDPKLNGVAVRPPVDAIREFEVLTSVPDASFGRSAGAQVNVVTRSGSNRAQGTAYEFMRTSAFNARNYFAPESEPAPDYQRHQYGVSYGAPLQRDRWFIFGDYEGTRLSEGITRVTNVPTLLERDGNFSEGRFGAPINPFTGMPFPGNAIPPAFQHPVGQALAQLYPEPNRSDPYANYVSSPNQIDDVDQFDVRVDEVRRGSTLTARYSFSDRRYFEPFAGSGFAAVPGYGNDVDRRAQNLSGSHVSTMGRFVNEARAGWTRVSSGVFQENQGTSVNQSVGLPELSTDPRDWGLSLATVGGYSAIGHEYNNPQHGTTNMWQLSDTVSWMSGRHLFKAGGEVRGLGQEAYRDVQARGQLVFTSQAFTGNALADLLLGLPTATVGATLDNLQNLRTTSAAFYVQDTMQVSPTLTLSAGLRYELNTPPVDAFDRVSLYDPDTGTVVPVGEGDMPRAGYSADLNNFAPRLGAAWAARPSTLVRAGYGISYDQAALAPNEFLYFNPPYFTLGTYFTIPGLYTLTLSDPWPASFPIALPASVTSVQDDLRTGYLHQWNVSVQQQLGSSRTIELAYVGTRGRNLIAARDINQPAPSPDPFNPRPNPYYADITTIESRAHSSFDAFEVRLDQRLNRGFSLQAAYTLGSSEDDASAFFSSAGDANFPQDSNNPGAEWARSNFDVRHRFSLSGLWQLPFGGDRKWLNAGFGATCLGNWDMYFVLSMQTGRPFTVAIHPDIDNSNTGRASLGFGSNDRPNVIGNPVLSNPTPERWFNTGAFSMPPYGSFGDAGRNLLDGPGAKLLNLAFTRRVPFNHGALQVRLELYNVFNWTNFDLPDNFLGSPTFGQILSAGSPRRFQLGVRYMF